MNIGEFAVKQEISEIKTDDKSSISRESLEKFDRIMCEDSLEPISTAEDVDPLIKSDEAESKFYNMFESEDFFKNPMNVNVVKNETTDNKTVDNYGSTELNLTKKVEITKNFAENLTTDSSEETDKTEEKEVNEPIKNKQDGLAREREVAEELNEKYPIEEGYKIVSEAYLRDKNGNIVKDPVTGEARRIDFVVVKDGKVVDSVEVTSKTADKTEQSAKEQRIRDAGGNYIRDDNGNLVRIPENVQTRIERRD